MSNYDNERAREEYFNELAEQQRQEEEYQMQEQGYVAQLESELQAVKDQLREAVEVVKRYEPYRVVMWVPVEGKNECVLREVWLAREFLTKHQLNSEEV